jgi:hypothetical protein
LLPFLFSIYLDAGDIKSKYLGDPRNYIQAHRCVRKVEPVVKSVPIHSNKKQQRRRDINGEKIGRSREGWFGDLYHVKGNKLSDLSRPGS